MTTYDFYQSGVREARFTVENGAATVNDQPLTGDLAKYWQRYARFDVVTWFAGIAGQPVPAEPTFKLVGHQYQATSDPQRFIERHARPAVNLIAQDGIVVGAETTTHMTVNVLIQVGAEALTSLHYWQAADRLLPGPPAIGEPTEVMIPMRDGVQLATTILRPTGDQPVSVLLMRTPYGRELDLLTPRQFVQRGYAVALQDVRGRNDSEGVWSPLEYEQDDGQDTIQWLAAQSWSTGNVGMYGGSYSGEVQWAAAGSGEPHLKAILSVVTAGGPFDDMFFRGGAPMEGVLPWFAATADRYFDPGRMVRDDWAKLLKIRPLPKILAAVNGHEIKAYSRLLKHPVYDDFHEQLDWQTRADRIKVPAFIQSGWYDDDGIGTTDALRITANYPTGNRRVVLGAWPHAGNMQYDLGPIALGENGLRFDLDLLHLQWFDHFLNGEANGIEQGAPVSYYITGKDEWREAATFPPTQQPTRWLLDAKTAEMGPTPPAEAGSATYDYDPADPTPHLIDVSQNEFEWPNDYAAVEQRPDVASFTSAPLTEGLTIVGWFAVDFYAKSSAVNTDWVVRITDVDEAGRSLNVADQAMNALFRHSQREPEAVAPGQVLHYTMQTQKNGYYFKPGHRLRLDFASAAENLIFPNSNTAGGAYVSGGVVAHQAIMTGPKWPSSLSFFTDK